MVKFLKLRRIVNKFIRIRPKLFIYIMSRRNKFKDIIVNNNTEIVIEGYPRSANTFAVAAFVYSQGRDVSIARHTHAPAQLILAVNARLPVIFLIRKPMDAVISLVIRDEAISLKYALQTYIWYHRSLLTIVKDCVIADFSQVTENYSTIINDVNSKYGKKYQLFDHNKESESDIFNLVEMMEVNDSGGALRESHVARPSKSRMNRKKELQEQLLLPENSRLLKECTRLYNEIVMG